jgi:hypothetical protein
VIGATEEEREMYGYGGNERKGESAVAEGPSTLKNFIFAFVKKIMPPFTH